MNCLPPDADSFRAFRRFGQLLRSRRLPLLCALLCACGLAGQNADSARRRLPAPNENAAVDAAIGRGVAWLAAQQDPDLGHFGGKPVNAYTGLCCLAMMAAGEQPGRSEFGDVLARGIRFLIRETAKGNGYLGGDGGRMYSHGICTLALATAYGMLDTVDGNRQLGEALRRALAVTLDAQVKAPDSPHHGGWRYEPNAKDADLSVTVWQALSLKVARDCGMPIPDPAFDGCREYVRRTHDGEGFCYQPGQSGTPAARMSGIVCMKALRGDQQEADQVKIATSARVLEQIDCANGKYFYYQSYYLAMAAAALEEPVRNAFLPKLETALLNLQREDGQFAKHSGYAGGVHATAFAILALAANYQYLPVH